METVFFCPTLVGEQVILPVEEQEHAVKVLRLKSGDAVVLTDGKGTLAKAFVKDISKKHCEVTIFEKWLGYQARKHRIHLAVALTKSSDRNEWFLEKATEMGIDVITPILCRNSERLKFNPERLHKILISAMKQSQKAYLPLLRSPMKFSEMMEEQQSAHQLFIAHCREDEDKKKLSALYQQPGDVLMLIGPEGDFTKEEIAYAKEKGYKSVSLSTSRLRTETAAMMACAALNFVNGE